MEIKKGEEKKGNERDGEKGRYISDEGIKAA